MKYKETIELPKIRLRAFSRLFSYRREEMLEHNIHPFSNIWKWTTWFGNGYEVDIKLNASEDDVWSEAVLFDEYGNELCCTEVCDTLEGKWRFEFNGDTYEVELRGV